VIDIKKGLVSGIFNVKHFLKVEEKLKLAFSSIKEEITDHKDSINQNTNEIQSNYEYLCKLESKIDKLTERVDELTLFITNDSTQANEYSLSPLTQREQEVFLALYTSECDFVTYKHLVRVTQLGENLVVNYINNLIMKGVPVIKRYINSEVQVSLDPAFKALQAKNNLVKINEVVSSRIALDG